MAGERAVTHDMRAQEPVRADAAIAELAEGQHGVVARAQLLALGLGRSAIAERLRKQRLHRIHRGVYAVGYRRVTRLGWWLAAVLACGPGAVVSHRCAGALQGILEGWPATVDVSVPGERHSRRGIRVHRMAIADDERTVVASVPVTTAARTLLDLAGDGRGAQTSGDQERARASLPQLPRDERPSASADQRLADRRAATGSRSTAPGQTSG
ncbi:MAG: hypothetical protein QOE60_2277 [Thermoleophilaceae bacterium]|jgi:predicted transcriptional regulator of viral defense system|nr:hypothetical protein [Thermoleophilaceae bacterium]